METYKGTTLETKSIERYGNPTVDEIKYKKTAYQYLKNENKGSLENIAFSFLGNKVLYGDFFEKIEETAKALTSMGLKKRDRVAILMPNIPETAYIQYAANRMGVVCDFIDPRTKPDTLIEMLKSENANNIILVDAIANELLNSDFPSLLKDTNVRSVMIVPALLSASKLFSSISSVKESLFGRKRISKMNGVDFYYYDDALNNSKYTFFNDSLYVENSPAIVTHSSGSTTGVPSPIIITNENMNSIAYQHELANLTFEPGKKLLHILPYFAAYGSACCTHMGLSFGMELDEIAKFDIAKVGRLIYKFKPNIVFGNPAWFLAMTKDHALKNADFSFLDCVVAGGASLTETDEKIVNDWLIKHNAHCLLSKGYGLSEISGCGTYTCSDEYNKYGYSGIALPLTQIAILDSKTKTLVKKDNDGNIVGEAAVSGPSVINKSLNPLKKDKYISIDGEDYYLTGDTVLVDQTGNLKHIERIDRAFSRYDGYKVHPGDIERKIRNYGFVDACSIVSYFSDDRCGSMPVAYVTVPANNELTNREIVERIINSMLNDKTTTTRDIPSKWVFLNSMPLNAMSKVDFRFLQTELPEGEESISVEFIESNLGFSYKIVNKQKTLKLK